MGTRTKNFGGKRFRGIKTFKTKSLAKKDAKPRRKTHNVRIIPSGSRFALFIRKKGK